MNIGPIEKIIDTLIYIKIVVSRSTNQTTKNQKLSGFKPLNPTDIFGTIRDQKKNKFWKCLYQQATKQA